jgi:hypothetical protein
LLRDCVVIRMDVHVVLEIAVWDRDEVPWVRVRRYSRLPYTLCFVLVLCAGLMVGDVVERGGGGVMKWWLVLLRS